MTLIGYWPLNEASGNTAYDHSGNENHGTINDGGDSTVPGANGILGQNAYNFDGENDFVYIGSGPSDYLADSGFTFSVWIKTSDTSDYPVLIGINTSTGDNSVLWTIRYDVSRIYFGETGNEYTGSTVINDGNWHHLTVTLDSSGEGKFFVDGSSENIDNFSTSARVKKDDIVSIGQEYDGGTSDSNTSDYINGTISEVRIYDRALTQSEIQYLYSVGKRGLQTTNKKTS